MAQPPAGKWCHCAFTTCIATSQASCPVQRSLFGLYEERAETSIVCKYGIIGCSEGLIVLAKMPALEVMQLARSKGPVGGCPWRPRQSLWRCQGAGASKALSLLDGSG